jgi:hypothetical protein
MSQARHSSGITLWYRLGWLVKKSRMCTPPHNVWKTLEAAENRSSDSTYESALAKSSANGSGFEGGIVLEKVELCFI